jgi:hypothetical protein
MSSSISIIEVDLDSAADFDNALEGSLLMPKKMPKKMPSKLGITKKNTR